MYDPKKDPAFVNNQYLTDYDFNNDVNYEQTYDECNACYTPNPPWWCSDPNNSCYNASVPIEPGFCLVLISFLFGSYLIQKRFGFK